MQSLSLQSIQLISISCMVLRFTHPGPAHGTAPSTAWHLPGVPLAPRAGVGVRCHIGHIWCEEWHCWTESKGHWALPCHPAASAVVLWEPGISCQLLRGTFWLQPLVKSTGELSGSMRQPPLLPAGLGQHCQPAALILLVCLYLTRRAGDRRRLSSVLKLEPVLLGGSDPISLQRIRVWHSQSVVHIGSVSAELFLTTKNISGRVTVCCNHIFPVFLCDNYSHKYHCFTSAQ